MTSYLNFVAEVVNGKCFYRIINDKQERLGQLIKIRVGKWESWCLYLHQDCYMSASCLDEVREKIRSLNNNKFEAI